MGFPSFESLGVVGGHGRLLITLKIRMISGQRESFIVAIIVDWVETESAIPLQAFTRYGRS